MGTYAAEFRIGQSNSPIVRSPGGMDGGELRNLLGPQRCGNGPVQIDRCRQTPLHVRLNGYVGVAQKAVILEIDGEHSGDFIRGAVDVGADSREAAHQQRAGRTGGGQSRANSAGRDSQGSAGLHTRAARCIKSQERHQTRACHFKNGNTGPHFCAADAEADACPEGAAALINPVNLAANEPRSRRDRAGGSKHGRIRRVGAKLSGCAAGEVCDDLVPEDALLTRGTLAKLEGGHRGRKPLHPDTRRGLSKWTGMIPKRVNSDRTAGAKRQEAGKA